MIISLYYLMYLEEVQNLTKKQYDKLSNKVMTLKNTEKYVTMLLDKNNFIDNIPYLDELINLEDDFVINREKKKYSKKIQKTFLNR